MVKNGLRLALCAGACLFAAAATPAVAAEPIRLNCGGIGLEESEVMRAEVGKHALTILFTTPEGRYLSDVRTRVEDPLNARQAEAACGPIGQVDIAEPGRYRVVATYGGRTETKWFDLKPTGGARTVLRWTE